LSAVRGSDALTIDVAFERYFVSETGADDTSLFRAADDARSFFFQLEGRATIKGRIDGQRVDQTGHAYSETFRVER
jgi:hypothetical protein